MGDNRGIWAAALGAAGYLAWSTIRRRRELDLRGRTVLITGGSRGLGLVLARQFAAEGARVVICARDMLELERAREDLERRGAEVLALPCDLATRIEVEEMVEDATERFGAIDVLVNNAGIIQTGPLGSMTHADFQRAMENTFFSALNATLAVLPQMRARREGRIVNITSIGGRVAVPHLLPYCTAKFAFRGLSEGLHAELAQDGIRVTTVVPGLMRTGSPPNAFFKGQHEKEFTLFTLSDSMPGISMGAERAARRIVEATRKGEAEVTLTLAAKAAALLHGLMPGVTARAFGAVNRLLPSPDGAAGTRRIRGMHLATGLVPSPLTALTNRAARRNNEYGGTPSPTPEHAERAGL